MNYPLTITAGEGEGACSKGHSPKSSPVQCYTPKEGGVRDALIVYSFSIPNILQTVANKTRARQTFTSWTPK